MGVSQTLKDIGLNISKELVNPHMEDSSVVEQVKVNSVQSQENGKVEYVCKCDRGQHFNCKIKDLGQKQWATVSKTELARLDVATIHNKCEELIQFINQHDQHTGFIPLSP